MKRQRLFIFWLTGALLLLSPFLSAQEQPSATSFLSARIGPALYTGHLMGITSRSGDYCNRLRKGLSWNLGYWYTGQRTRKGSAVLRPGFLYQGSRFQATQPDGSDKIHLNYLAPQLGIFLLQNKYRLLLSGGAGYQFYTDKSTVYDKPRTVSMDRLACNLALDGEYLLSSRWGISARCDWLFSHSESYSVTYHGTDWKVEHPGSGEGYFGQLSLTFGLNYYF